MSSEPNKQALIDAFISTPSLKCSGKVIHCSKQKKQKKKMAASLFGRPCFYAINHIFTCLVLVKLKLLGPLKFHYRVFKVISILAKTIITCDYF